MPLRAFALQWRDSRNLNGFSAQCQMAARRCLLCCSASISMLDSYG